MMRLNDGNQEKNGKRDGKQYGMWCARRNRKAPHWVVLTVFLCLVVMACGRQADGDIKTGAEEVGMGAGAEAGIEEAGGAKAEAGSEGGTAGEDGTGSKDGSVGGDGTEAKDGSVGEDGTETKGGSVGGEGTGRKDGSAGEDGTETKDGSVGGDGTENKDGSTGESGTGTAAENRGTGENTAGADAKRENADVIEVYTPEELEYTEEVIPAVYMDDLSLLDHMEQADSGYAYRDGMVYYRQYRKDSFESGALWADYAPTVGTDKEIVRIDAAGEKTVLFSDQGYGSIYLVGERFYMTEKIMKEGVSGSRIYSNVYSVDMQGQNRVDYGYGEIYAVDTDREALILKRELEDTWKGTYSALDCRSGEMIPLAIDSCESQTFWDYHDGWCYFDVHREGESDICRVIAMSLEGEQREIIALTPNRGAEEVFGYTEGICQLGTDGDRIYIVYGGYAGTGHFYQGGRIITVKLDGSDYRAIESDADAYYVCHDAGRTLVYVPRMQYFPDDKDGYETMVWDVEGNLTFLSDFPSELIWGWKTHAEMPYREYMAPRPLCLVNWVGDGAGDFYALPDDSGRIVRVAMGFKKDVTPRGGGEVDYIDYGNFYYADGFLYFDVEFNIYDAEYAIGWRDGYDRLQTDVYRLNLETGTVEVLYSY